MARKLRLLAIALVAFMAASLLSLYSYGRFAERAQGPAGHALPLQEGGALDRAIVPLTEAHPQRSGLALLSDNLDAFAVRAITARMAGRSLDLQYYLWHDDFTGHLLDYELLRAADRGVRVRLLLDDLNAQGGDSPLAALEAHPNVEIRMFNPTRNRAGTLGRGVEMLLRGFSLNRRMHNKAWIADGRIAVVGGRNIGDEYFDAAAETNFLDLDAIVVGPAVQQTEAIFDEFWNSPSAIPLAALKKPDPAALPELRRAMAVAEELLRDHPYRQRLAESPDVRAFLAGKRPLHWPEQVEVISDPAVKMKDEGRERWLVRPLIEAMGQAQDELKVISPYFVPGRQGVDWLRRQRARGVEIGVLTNSLAATDVMAVHSGYAPYRRPLLEAGVELHELTPRGARDSSLFGSSGASLHTKAFVVDGHAGFIGSFNLDPRSVNLNTEMGVLFRDAAAARELLARYEEKVSPRHSYRLSLRGDALVWRDETGEPPRDWEHEPETSAWLRATVWGLGWLPLESQL